MPNQRYACNRCPGTIAFPAGLPVADGSVGRCRACQAVHVLSEVALGWLVANYDHKRTMLRAKAGRISAATGTPVPPVLPAEPLPDLVCTRDGCGCRFYPGDRDALARHEARAHRQVDIGWAERRIA